MRLRFTWMTLQVLAGVWLAGCAASQPRAGAEGARLFDGLGTHQRTITTKSSEAQRYFDQGLVWAYAFNHDEAIRSFRKATELDPDCAMAWWGIALCNGPHINNPLVDREHATSAWTALQRAKTLLTGASAVEVALINAVGERYAPPPVAERRALDEAYAAAMSKVRALYPDDNDVATLYAESLMDLQPWDLWTKAGQPKGRTEEILTVLEEVLARDAGHPGANHLYIHAQEAGPHPEKASAAAERLRTAVPAAGHLVHMPSHIDVQVGRWAQAAEQNQRAIEADRQYRKLSPTQGFYNVYMAHNPHFLAFASMMEGRSETALKAARQVVADMPVEFVRDQAALADPFMVTPIHVLMRFGRWDDVLKEPPPAEKLPISNALWHFARGVAYAAKGDIENANKEQAALVDAVRVIPEGTMVSINPAHKVLAIANHMLAGEIAYRRGDISAAVSELRAAVAAEDALMYMEPPDWVQPVRHTLGAVLTSAKRWEEAEQVYREDLQNWPENGWSLYGLSRCLAARGATAEAAAMKQRFEKVWSRADVQIESSCYCTAGQ